MKPDIFIFKESESLSRRAATLFKEKSNQAIHERGRCLIALSGGGTPERLFQLLASDYRKEIRWNQIHLFWGDERCVSPTTPGSNYRQADEALLSKVAIPKENAHRIKGELDPSSAAQEYAGLLKTFAPPGLDFPALDLVYLGVGEDGHTASLFPHSPVQAREPVIAVTANYQDRPANRVTLTQMVFNQAQTIVFMATGEKKADILAKILSNRYNPEVYPAQRIDPQNGQSIWLIDEAAASRLPRNLKRLNFCEG